MKVKGFSLFGSSTLFAIYLDYVQTHEEDTEGSGKLVPDDLQRGKPTDVREKGLIKQTSLTVFLLSFPDAPQKALPRILMRNRLSCSVPHLQISKQGHCCPFLLRVQEGFVLNSPL